MIAKHAQSSDASSDELWRTVVSHMRHKDDVRAERICREAIVRFSEEARWHLALAWIVTKKGQYREALNAARQAVELEPDQPLGYRTMAMAFLGLQDGKMALDAALLAYRLDPAPTTLDIVKRARAMVRNRPVPPSGFDDGTELETRRIRAASLRAEERTQVELPAVAVEQTRPKLRMRRRTTRDSVVFGAALEAQLQGMFGASVFGTWGSRSGASPTWVHRDRSGSEGTASLGRVLAVVLALLLLAAVGTVLTRGIQHKRERERQELAEHVEQLLQLGSLEELAQLMPRLDAMMTAEGTASAHRALYARAESTLYRFYDAAPPRRRLAEQHLKTLSSISSRDALVASSLLLSQGELLSVHEQLQGMQKRYPKDAEVAFLNAIVRKLTGEQDDALDSLESAREVEPANLHHVMEEVRFRLTFRRSTTVLNLANHAQDVNPTASETRLLQALVTPRQARGRLSALEALLKEPAKLSPVIAAVAALDAARIALAQSDTKKGNDLLQRFADTIHRQPPFLLDAADTLVEEGHAEHARKLLDLVDANDRGRIQPYEGRALAALGQTKAARKLLVAAWSKGSVDPRVGEAILAIGAQPPAPNEVAIFARLSKTWPSNIHLQVAHALALAASDKVDEAAALLTDDIVQDRRLPRRSRASAWVVLARAELTKGDAEKALALTQRAVKEDESNTTAGELLAKLEAQLQPPKRDRGRKSRRRR